MQVTRRAALTAVAAASYRRVLGPNDRVQVGFIGYGLIGAQHVFDFKNQKDVDLAALCDVYQPRLAQGVAPTGQVAGPYSDFRKMLRFLTPETFPRGRSAHRYAGSSVARLDPFRSCSSLPTYFCVNP